MEKMKRLMRAPTDAIQRILSLVGLFVYGIEVCYQKIACVDFKWCVLLDSD